MFRLKRDNVVKLIDSEVVKDKYIAQGFELLDDATDEDATNEPLVGVVGNKEATTAIDGVEEILTTEDKGGEDNDETGKSNSGGKRGKVKS